jgi:predicted phage tail protein
VGAVAGAGEVVMVGSAGAVVAAPAVNWPAIGGALLSAGVLQAVSPRPKALRARKPSVSRADERFMIVSFGGPPVAARSGFCWPVGV